MQKLEVVDQLMHAVQFSIALKQILLWYVDSEFGVGFDQLRFANLEVHVRLILLAL